MDFDSLFPSASSTNTLVGDLEVMVRDDKQKIQIFEEYKKRLCNNRDGQRKYTAIIRKGEYQGG